MQSFVNEGQIKLPAMHLEFLDDEETVLQTLRRRYADLSAWLVRANRAPEPARLPEPTRPESPTRPDAPTRQPRQPRPQ